MTRQTDNLRTPTPQQAAEPDAKPIRQRRLAGTCLALAVAGAATLVATPNNGLTLTTITTATAADGVSEHVQINKAPNQQVVPWQLQLQAQGETDYIVAHLTLPPGGHSGWHSHPGILVAGVVAGQVDFYDQNCAVSRYGAGSVYTENQNVHGIYNSGNETADLYITFLVKHGAGRRRDEAAPACASLTPIQ
jgi:quercetin dioxygenase-like cupin family protein